MLGKTFAEFDRLSSAPGSASNVDNVLTYIVNHKFTPGDGIHNPETLTEQANIANELMELRKKLGLYKPVPPKKK